MADLQTSPYWRIFNPPSTPVQSPPSYPELETPVSSQRPLFGLDQEGWADTASLIGAFGRGEKANRMTRGDWTQLYDKLMMESQAAQERREGDALGKLAVTDYLKSGGNEYKPATLTGRSGTPRTLASFGFGPKAVSPEVQASAAGLQTQLRGRLLPGEAYTPTDLDEYADPGTLERISDYGSMATGGLGILSQLLGGGGNSVGEAVNAATGAGGTGGLFSKIPGLGGKLSSILPYAGAAGGILGLIKNNDPVSNIASGVGAGASIGSIVPGLGTGIGAGIGALVGALRGIGNSGPSEEEKEGRVAATQMRQALTAAATPSQKAEAGGDEASLLHIIVRDNALRKGLGSAAAETQASNAVRALWESEKSGSEGVSSAGSRISGLLG